MLVIRPLALTPAMVTASNAGAADPNYSPATSYTLGQRAYLPDDGITYECVQAPALDQYPPTSPLYWMRAEPSNRWAMWDAEISTATQVAGNLTATIAVPGRFNGAGFFGLAGDSISLVQKSAGGATLWSATTALKSNPSGWSSYFFEPRTQVRAAVFVDLVPSVGSTLEITIAGSSTACAAVVLGNTFDLGAAQYGASSSLISYSRKETSSSGVQTLRKGRSSKRASITLEQPRAQYNAASAVLEALDAVPAVYIGVPESGDYEPLTILGFYRDFQVEVSYPNHHICSLEIEGLSS
jgi:hypothetical protein